MNKRLICAIVLMIAAVAGVFAGWQMERDRSTVTYNKNNLIRFHVLANSNLVEDQALKYQVRDVIVNSMAARFQHVDDVVEARQVVQDSLQDISDLAVNCIRSRGYDYPVRVSLGDYAFPEKSYRFDKAGGQIASLTLPEDTYEAVRVEIGEGKGDNWWCVLFPPLCFVDFNNTQSDTAVPAGSFTGNSKPEQYGGSVNNRAPEEQIREKETETNEINVREERPETGTENDDAVVKAFKLVPPGEEIRAEGLPGDSGNSSVRFRFRCVEIYDHALAWFSRTFGNGRA